MGNSGRGVPQSTTNPLDTNNSNDFSNNGFFACCCFSYSTQYVVRVRFRVAVLCLFAHLLLVYRRIIVFIWLSTQTKRKLWRLVSLASGREPS